MFNSNVGFIVVLFGIYGSFVVNSGSGFVFGVVGVIELVIYNLQNFIFNGGSCIEIVGLVIFMFVGGFLVNSGVMFFEYVVEWFILQLVLGGFLLNGVVVFLVKVIVLSGIVILNGKFMLYGIVKVDCLIVN